MECNGINMTPNGQSTSIDGQSNWRSWGLSALCILTKIHNSFFGGLCEWWEWDYLIGAVVTSQYLAE
jgi:hypothetical protein